MLRAGGQDVVIDPSARSAYHALEARLRPFVARRVANPSAVDDVVQDVFVRVQRGLASLRDDERFVPWLYQVARSAIADRHRTEGRQPLLMDPLPEQAADAGEPQGDVACELASYVAGFVAMLPSPYRDALTLTELEGLSQREAAEMCEVSLSGMKSRVQRGREQLRALIDQCCRIAVDARGRVISCVPRPDGIRPRRDCC
jgi:RNA polymerase sigma-70 factor, ECF subfamily